MKLRPLVLVLAATSALGVSGSALAACFDWSTPAVSDVVDSGKPDATPGDTGAVPDAEPGGPDAELPTCGPPITPPGPPSLHLTLDDLASLSTPLAGSAFGSVVTGITESDFALGVCNKALHFKAGLHLSYPEVPPEAGDAGVPNISYAQGTVMMWYRPDYPEGDIVERAILRTSGVINRGGIRVSRGKFGGVGFYYWNAAGVFAGQIESPMKLAQGRWVHIAVSWQAGAAPRIFLNGVLDVSVNAVVIDGAAAKSSASQLVGIGNNPTAAETPADGLIDDVRFYPTPLP